jgi:hypothetical protein
MVHCLPAHKTSDGRMLWLLAYKAASFLQAMNRLLVLLQSSTHAFGVRVSDTSDWASASRCQLGSTRPSLGIAGDRSALPTAWGPASPGSLVWVSCSAHCFHCVIIQAGKGCINELNAYDISTCEYLAGSST